MGKIMKGWKTWVGVGLVGFAHVIPFLDPSWQGKATDILDLAGKIFTVIGLGSKLDRAAQPGQEQK